jgi:hypothetical protein
VCGQVWCVQDIVPFGQVRCLLEIVPVSSQASGERAKSPWWAISPLMVTMVTRFARTWMMAVTYWWVCSSARVMVLPKRLTMRLERT